MAQVLEDEALMSRKLPTIVTSAAMTAAAEVVEPAAEQRPRSAGSPPRRAADDREQRHPAEPQRRELGRNRGPGEGGLRLARVPVRRSRRGSRRPRGLPSEDLQQDLEPARSQGSASTTRDDEEEPRHRVAAPVQADAGTWRGSPRWRRWRPARRNRRSNPPDAPSPTYRDATTTSAPLRSVLAHEFGIISGGCCRSPSMTTQRSDAAACPPADRAAQAARRALPMDEPDRERRRGGHRPDDAGVSSVAVVDEEDLGLEPAQRVAETAHQFGDIGRLVERRHDDRHLARIRGGRCDRAALVGDVLRRVRGRYIRVPARAVECHAAPTCRAPGSPGHPAGHVEARTLSEGRTGAFRVKGVKSPATPAAEGSARLRRRRPRTARPSGGRAARPICAASRTAAP